MINESRQAPPYPSDLDCVWFGKDLDGYLGAFITAGSGPIPTSLLAELGEEIWKIEAFVKDIPVSSSVDLHIDVPHPGGFTEIASRGFFVFDWRNMENAVDESNASYQVVAAPRIPLRIETVRPELVESLRLVVLNNCLFKDCKSVDLLGITKGPDPIAWTIGNGGN